MEEPESAISTSSTEGSNLDEEVERRARFRAKIIKEIMDTEKTYQRHLELVIQYFEGPLHDLDLVPEHVIVTIFSNVRQIVSINQELLEHLEQTGVGQSFLRMGPFLKLYSTYANNHERALGAMIEWEQKRPEFGAWRRRQEELPEMMGLRLNSLLITPVQRVPRYKLLLEDLLANTEKSHEDYPSIEEAVKQISAVASHINEHIRQHENFNKMLAIQKSLVGSGAPRILTPGRIFIKDGPLKKVSKKGGRSHVRMFFLFSDILLYAKPKFVDQVMAGSYVCCCVFPLHHCVVNTVFGHSQSLGSLFTVKCKNESLLLYSDQKTVQSWITMLHNTIERLTECRQTLRKPSSALEPLRRPGLVQLRKQLKEKDPLKHAKRTPDRVTHSPRSLKRALAEANINCLSPRKHLKKVHDGTHDHKPNISKVLNPVFSDSDTEDSTLAQKCTPSKKKLNTTQSLTSEDEATSSVGKSRQKRMAQRLMARIRYMGSSRKREKKAVSESEEPCSSVKCIFVSPEPPKQGPDCDINEILDPDKPKWDIFDVALPDAGSVWRPRLDTDPAYFRRPVRRRSVQSEADACLHRPHSEISANTSRIWKGRPDSEISDDLGANPEELCSPIDCCTDTDLQSIHRCDISPERLYGRWRERQEQAELEAESTIYRHSSREFLAGYTFDENGSPKPKIYHKQSESMLLPWKTEWITPSPPATSCTAKDGPQFRSPLEEPDTQSAVLSDRWQAIMDYDPAYPPAGFHTLPRMHLAEDDSDDTLESTPPQEHTPPTHHQPESITTPQKKNTA